MSQKVATQRSATRHPWHHPSFWKMLGADLFLIGFAAIAFPARTGDRLVVMVAAIILGSLLLNIALVSTVPSNLPDETAASGAPPRPAGAAVDGSARSVTMIRRSLQAHEAERAAIAEQLRATAAQQLAALTMHLTAARNATDDESIVTPLETARVLATDAVIELAALAEQIAPAWRGEFGLVPALDALHHRIVRRGLIECDLRSSGEPFPVRLPVARAMLRVAEEAIDNVERHAGARSATIDLSFAWPIVRLEIADDARGFDLAVLDCGDAGLGLFRARELLAHEGGAMQIESAPGQGTRVLATVDTSHEAAA